MKKFYDRDIKILHVEKLKTQLKLLGCSRLLMIRRSIAGAINSVEEREKIK